MNNSNQTIRTVRDAYRLIYGYQNALLQIIDKLKKAFDTPTYWSWDPTAGGPPPTRRKCPVTDSDGSTFLPLLWSEFTYTSKPLDMPAQSGDYSIFISHNADSDFTSENGPLNTLSSNASIAPSPEGATSELSVSVVVNLRGSTLTWDQIDGAVDASVNPWAAFECGETYDGYIQLGSANDWISEQPINLGKHSLGCVSSARPMSELSTYEAIDQFAEALKQRARELAD
ncbi:MAG: hypothetical protein PF501_10135 [Salinisphaera sp.]|jgi:hypothetical protein|nr:hypothetical protein [Salinisphaera sp.]